MSCDKIDTYMLQDLLEDTIDPLDRIFVEEHLKTCRVCRRELSELKLMFWELNNKNNYSAEIPYELDDLKNDLINNFLGDSKPRQVIDWQMNNIKMSGKFLEFLPGAKQTPEVLKKASKGLAREVTKGVKRLIAK